MRAVVVARETVALRRCKQIVQMCGDLGGTEPGVIIRQVIVNKTDARLAVACEDRRAWGGGVQGVARETPDELWRIRRIKDPIGILLGCHLVKGRRAAWYIVHMNFIQVLISIAAFKNSFDSVS